MPVQVGHVHLVLKSSKPYSKAAGIYAYAMARLADFLEGFGLLRLCRTAVTRSTITNREQWVTLQDTL